MFRQAAKLLAIAAMLVGFVNAQCNFTCGLQAAKAAASGHACCPDQQNQTPDKQSCPSPEVLPGSSPVAAADLGSSPQLSLLPTHTAPTAPSILTNHSRVWNTADSASRRSVTTFAILRI